MRNTWFVWSLALAGALHASFAVAVDIDELRLGLVATYRDAAKPVPVEIVRIDPLVALAWKANESAHPRLAADGGTVQWEGYLNILRAGNYRFSGRVRGQLSLSVGGKEVLAVTDQADAPELKQGPEVRLESGPQPITAKFTRPAGAARVEVIWQGPGFRAEPLPHDAAFHLPAKVPAALAAGNLMDRGRFLTEEQNCIGCHTPEPTDKIARALLPRQGPDLSQVGNRVHPGWLIHWLDNPQKVRPGAAMPRLFGDDETAKVEIYAVARYLASLGGPIKLPAKDPNPKSVLASVNSGQKVFNSAGCVTCHQETVKPGQPRAIYGLATATGEAPNFPLGSLGSKTTHDKMAAYLSNPLAIDPSGRMPALPLEGKEIQDLAQYLCHAVDKDINLELPAAPGQEKLLAAFSRLQTKPEEQTAFGKLAVDAQAIDLGRRLVLERGCTNCHHVAPGGKTLPKHDAKDTFEAIKTAKSQTAGCLADAPAQRGKAPLFALADADRKALRSFLQHGTTGAGSPAPAYMARIAVQRFNCLACHNRDGEGGLPSELVEDLRKYEKAENAEAVNPPVLSGVGHKLRTPWLKQVLVQKGRARPWMGLRMPQFGEANVGQLAEAFAVAEGTEPDVTLHNIPLNTAKIEAGKHLVGKNAFGCISCHDLAGIPNTGTRGPDLAGMNQRVRYEWYQRWLEQPQKIQPGTRMPQVFPDGKSLLEKVLGGDANAQGEAMWAYLSLGPTLPLPEGMEPPKGLVLTVTDSPYILRTFMPETGSRCIAVGYPGGVSVDFDAATCRLGYAWSGNFLDASPLWKDRGGNPAKVLGAKFWTAPPGCPWSINDSNEPPDFSAQAKDPAYGGPLPANKVLKGVRQLEFTGYTVDDAGMPTFRYRLEAGHTEPVTVTERPEALRNPAGVGVNRKFTLTAQGARTPWLLAGESSSEPRLLDGKGEPVAIDLKPLRVEVPTADRLVVLPQSGDKVVILRLAAAPQGTAWLLQKQGNQWQAILRLSALAKDTATKVDLNVWAPYRADAALLKELVTSK